jgi:hypothetical protein
MTHNETTTTTPAASSAAFVGPASTGAEVVPLGRAVVSPTRPGGEVCADRWTVLAHSPEPGRWEWAPRWNHAMAMRASDDGTLIVMHRKRPDGWELVARTAGPAWRKSVRRR